MKNILQQSLVKLIVGLVAFTCIIASVSIYFKNNPYNRAILATCRWEATAKTWIDENENQIWDENEYPLSDVQIFVDLIEINNDSTIRLKNIGSQTTTDSRGVTKVSAFHPCHPVNYEIYAKSPSGYKFTTPELISLETSPNKIFLFGFITK